MDYGPYSEIYDQEYEDYTDDVNFYANMARRCPGPALELGCGTGRVLIPVAKAGNDVWGLDRSPEMLAKLEQKLGDLPTAAARRITLVEADMTRFSLEQRFGLIYLPFREFMHLATVEEQTDCLECVHRHLRRDGKLVINLYDIDLTTLVMQKTDDSPLYRQKLGDYTDRDTGHPVLLSASSSYNWLEQTLHEERFYDHLQDNGVIGQRRVIFLSQRWTFRWEMTHLLHRCGFRVEHLYGGYLGQGVTRMGSELIFVARPANERELRKEMKVLQERLARLEAD